MIINFIGYFMDIFKKTRVNWLEKFYLLLIALIFCLVVSTPYIIKEGLSFMREEYLEGSLIAILLGIGFFIVRLYRKELVRSSQKLSVLHEERVDVEEKLEEAFKYIGALNVQISAIRSLSTELDKYPETKSDMKNILKFLADKALSIVPVDWVILRIIDLNSGKTLRETVRARSSAVLIKYHIDNDDLVQEKSLEEYEALASPVSNMTIRVFCLMPKIKLSEEQKVMLTAIVKQVEMLFIIFESRYYKHRVSEKK